MWSMRGWLHVVEEDLVVGFAGLAGIYARCQQTRGGVCFVSRCIQGWLHVVEEDLVVGFAAYVTSASPNARK